MTLKDEMKVALSKNTIGDVVMALHDALTGHPWVMGAGPGDPREVAPILHEAAAHMRARGIDGIQLAHVNTPTGIDPTASEHIVNTIRARYACEIQAYFGLHANSVETNAVVRWAVLAGHSDELKFPRAE